MVIATAEVALRPIGNSRADPSDVILVPADSGDASRVPGRMIASRATAC
jgi:hypothetical protein